MLPVSLVLLQGDGFSWIETIITCMLTSEMVDPIWIDRPQSLQDLTKILSATDIFGVDTESNSLFAYREQVCLIQISTHEADYLIDPLALKNTAILGPLFADPRIEKVFHAGEYDVICLKRDFGFEFNNLFDTMIASRILGREAFGLSGMLETEFGVAQDKKYQRANWGIRPIPPAQLSYARLDSHFLIPLRERMKQELIEADRWELAVEDFHRLERTPVPSLNGDKENYWKLISKQNLNLKQMAVLKQLCEFRETQARKANLPSFKILSNETLIALAQALPSRAEEMEEITGLTPRLQKRYGAGLLECIAKGQETTPPRRPSRPRKDDELIQRLESLKSWRKNTAASYHVESDVILPREVVEQVASVNPRSMSELSALMVHFPWRLHRFGEDILLTLKPRETQ